MMIGERFLVLDGVQWCQRSVTSSPAKEANATETMGPVVLRVPPSDQ